jgi:ubiquinone/menaquinone biosynthesis C-methylase UbiE
VDFTREDDRAQDGDEGKSVAVGLVQDLSSWGMAYYLGWRWYDLDREEVSTDFDNINAVAACQRDHKVQSSMDEPSDCRREITLKARSAVTRGRTLDHAAPVYDLCEPLLMLGKQGAYNREIVALLELQDQHRVLDLGCGTGELTRMIADRLDCAKGGLAVGIDAAARMIALARKKRGNDVCRFEVAAAENLPYENASFDAVVSSLFFHHVDLELKQRALAEAYRLLKPGGKLIIADMHTPTTRTGWLVSWTARWFFMQPEIAENIHGVLPDLIATAGFSPPITKGVYLGYISIFTGTRPGGGHGEA